MLAQRLGAGLASAGEHDGRGIEDAATVALSVRARLTAGRTSRRRRSVAVLRRSVRLLPSRFLARAADRDLRVVLIVTGKGLRKESGRLIGGRIRSEFVGWLNRADNRAYVRAVRSAHAHHGGSGAFYLLLRRRSSARSRSLRATPQR